MPLRQSLSQLFQSHPHWPQVKSVVQTLHLKGYKAYLVGGCVRDGLMGQTANDFDIVTSATPDEVHALFPKALDLGKAFGVMVLPMQGYKLEVATFRKDKNYKDGRHPESVEFSDDVEDAKRRDFTVNALFYDPLNNAVIDHVDGLRDLEAKVLRCVGNPKTRFQEDHLRIIRAGRFVAQLGFLLEPETEAAMLDLSSKANQPSRERITDEFEKLVKTKFPSMGLEVFHRTKIFAEIFSGHKFHEDKSSWSVFLKGMERLGGLGRLSVLFTWINWNEYRFTKQPSELLKISPYFILPRQKVKEFNFLLQGLVEIDNQESEAFFRLNDSLGPLLTEVAFIAAECGLLSHHKVQIVLDDFLKKAGSKGQLPKPWITGDDLQRLGLRPSAEFGEILKECYLKQLHAELKSPDEAKDWAKKRATHGRGSSS